MKKWLFIIPIITCLAWVIKINEWKELDLQSFKISVPKQWKYISKQGEDSFIGEIKISKSTSLFYDCSSMGYANALLQTEQEYLKKGRWWDNCYFCKPDVIYTNNSPVTIKGVRNDEMKKRGVTDTSLVKVEGFPEYEATKEIKLPNALQKKAFPKADYIAKATYRDSTIYIPIEIPAEIKAHHIQIDSTDKYVLKTIWPKVPGKGMTGIYIHSRTASFNFQMAGVNLSPQDQELALNAFKTIKFNNK